MERVKEGVARQLSEQEHQREVHIQELEEWKGTLEDQIRNLQSNVREARRDLSRMGGLLGSRYPEDMPTPTMVEPEPSRLHRVSTPFPSSPTKKPSTTLHEPPSGLPPARMDALQPCPYTGMEPWHKWFRHFSEDMDLNIWNDLQRLHAMK